MVDRRTGRYQALEEPGYAFSYSLVGLLDLCRSRLQELVPELLTAELEEEFLLEGHQPGTETPCSVRKLLMLLIGQGNVTTVFQIMQNGSDAVTGDPGATEPGLSQDRLAYVVETRANEKSASHQDAGDRASPGLQIEIMLKESDKYGREHFPGLAAPASVITQGARVIEHVMPARQKAFVRRG